MLSYFFCKQCEIIKCEVSLQSDVWALVEGFQFSPYTRQQLQDPRLYTISIETITRHNHEAFKINRSSLMINCNPMEADHACVWLRSHTDRSTKRFQQFLFILNAHSIALSKENGAMWSLSNWFSNRRAEINYVKPKYVIIRAIRNNSEVLSSVKSQYKSITKI